MSTLLDAPITLRPLRTAAVQLMEACKASNTNANDIAGILQADAAMSVQLLRAANSPLYGYAGRVATIEHATVVLGFREVSRLSLAIASAELFNDSEGSQQLRKMLWDHSLGCACVARAIAQETSAATAEIAFLAGIVHDVGKLIFFGATHEEYEQVYRDSAGAETASYEAENYEVTHQELGVRCAEEWGLPYEIIDGIQLHHDADAVDRTDLVFVVAIANIYAHTWKLGSPANTTVPANDMSVLVEGALTSSQLERIEASARAEFEKMSQACSA